MIRRGICFFVVLLCCVHRSVEVNDNILGEPCQKEMLSKCIPNGKDDPLPPCFDNVTKYSSVYSEHKTNKSPACYLPNAGNTFGPNNWTINGRSGLKYRIADEQEDLVTRFGNSIKNSEFGEMSTWDLNGVDHCDKSGRKSYTSLLEFGSTASSGSSVQKHGISKGASQDINVRYFNNVTVTRTVTGNRTIDTGLVTVREHNTRNYCPADLQERFENTALALLYVNRNASLAEGNKRCVVKKGLLRKVEDRFKTAIKQLEHDNERRVERMLRNFSQDLDELKQRHQEQIRIYRDNYYNHKLQKRKDELSQDTYVNDVNNSLLTIKGRSISLLNINGANRSMAKLELKDIRFQRLNLQRVHKYELKLFQEQLEMEKHHLLQVHKMLLKNFESLGLLKYQWKNMSLQMQEAQMLWTVDEMRRKVINDIKIKSKEESKQNEFQLLEGKRTINRIRRFIKEKTKTLEAYYKESRKELHKKFFYKSYLNDGEISTYAQLLEKLDRKERRDKNDLKYSTRETSWNARKTIDMAYELRDLYSLRFKEKIGYNENFLNSCALNYELDYQQRKFKVLKETENNLAAEKSELVEKIELELANFKDKSNERFAELSTNHTSELNQLGNQTILTHI